MRPRRLLGASVQPLNFAVRRFGGNLVVTLGPQAVAEMENGYTYVVMESLRGLSALSASR